MPEAADPIATWLAANTFRCDQLRTHMTPERCGSRQKKPDEKDGKKDRYGWGAGHIPTPADKFCLSGECEQGRVVKLGLKKKIRKTR